MILEDVCLLVNKNNQARDGKTMRLKGAGGLAENNGGEQAHLREKFR